MIINGINISNLISNNIDIILLCLSGVILILFILCIISFIKIGKLKKKYKAFLSGNQGKSLEDTILTRFKEVDDLKNDIANLSTSVKGINEILTSTYQKVGIIKYDAFKEMGGKLSFVLALLDESNTGFLLNSMHSSREGCYTYIKEIIRGESFVVLSEEEKQALESAMKSRNYME